MDVQTAILKRRSVRAYTQEQITEEQLNSLLDAAYSSPVAGGRYNAMSLSVVRNPAALDKIRDYFRLESGAKNDVLYGAQTLIIVAGQKTFDSNALFANAGCILENIQLSAAGMGLGSVINWAAGTLLPNNNALLHELGISEDFRPLAGLAVGHAAHDPQTRSLKAVITTNFIR